ncbi:MAG: hypothetical protein ACRD9W_18795 [Terriglobia bacterium]
MSETDPDSSATEAVAVFQDVRSFQAAVDDLLLAGFDHADVNVLAHEQTVTSKLGHAYKSTADFEDDSEAPRIGYVPGETIGDAEGAVIGTGIYVPAIVGSLAVAATGGTMLGALAVAAIAGGAGGLIAAALARTIGREHARHLEQHLQHGGLLLWVRTCDAEHEEKALAILGRHSAEDVHLHEMPQRAGKESDIPRERPRIIRILERPEDVA